MDYTILPAEAFAVQRSCPGCGSKSRYVSTGKFRINANGSRLDVWLIYQCERCRHTWNAAVYERVRTLDADEYRRFAANDAGLALRYGTQRTLFAKNHAQIAEDIAYEIRENPQTAPQEKVWILRDPYRLKIRSERILAELLQISRSQVQKMIKEGRIHCEETAEGIKVVFTP